MEACILFHYNLQLLVFREIKKFKVRSTSLGVEASFRCTPPITHFCSFTDKDNTFNYMIHLFLTLYIIRGLHSTLHKQTVQPIQLK